MHERAGRDRVVEDGVAALVRERVAVQVETVALDVHAPAAGGVDGRVGGEDDVAEHVVGHAAAARLRVAERAAAVHAMARDGDLVRVEERRALRACVRGSDPERRAVFDGDGSGRAHGLEVCDGERALLHQNLARERRRGGGEHHLARAALHEPRVVTDGRAVRKRLAGVGRHHKIRPLSPRAAGKSRQRDHHRAQKGYLFHWFTFRTWRYHTTLRPFPASRNSARMGSRHLGGAPENGRLVRCGFGEGYFSKIIVPMIGPKL